MRAGRRQGEREGKRPQRRTTITTLNDYFYLFCWAAVMTPRSSRVSFGGGRLSIVSVNTQQSASEELEACNASPRVLSLGNLVVFTFFTVAGGPFGIEPSVRAAGPLLALLGILLLPWVWCLPVSLAAAELATAIPLNGGLVRYVEKALGHFPSYVCGFCVMASNFVGNASAVVLLITYVESLTGSLSVIVRVVIVIVAFALSFGLNFIGLEVVGIVNYVLLTFIFAPFVVLIFWAIPSIEPSNWDFVQPESHFQGGIFISNLLWNMMGFTSAASLAGEVKNPNRTFPLGMAISVVLVSLNYFIPLLVTTGNNNEWSNWHSGYIATVAGQIAGDWMQDWIVAASIVCQLSVLISSIAATMRIISCLADLSLFPPFFGKIHHRFHTPHVALSLITVVSVFITLIFILTNSSSSSVFNDLVQSTTILIALTIVMLFVSFVVMRVKQPFLSRPYRLPVGTAGSVAIGIIPSGLAVYITVTGALITLLTVGIFIFLSVVTYMLYHRLGLGKRTSSELSAPLFVK